MRHEDEVTPTETPDSKRLTIPELNLPENATPQDLAKALADALFAIAANLEHLKAMADARRGLESVNSFAIRKLGDHVEKRLAAITGRRWGRVQAIESAKLRLVAKTVGLMLAFGAVVAGATVAILRAVS